MKIEVKRLKEMNGDSSLKAFVDVLFGGKILVKGCRVVEGPNGLFASTPQQKNKEKWYPVVVVEGEDEYKQFQNVVVKAYQNHVGGNAESSEKIVDESSEDDF